MRFACFSLAIGLTSSTAFASPKAVDAPKVLAERDRAITSLRPVQVVVVQSRIETTIDLTRLPASANGGGLLGGLIISSMDDRAKTLTTALEAKAEIDAAPLRAALVGFDVDALALATTRTALATPEWFKPGEAILSKDGTVQARDAFVKSVTSPQAAIISYRYSLSSDFTNIRVIADVLLGKTQPGATTLTPFYRQHIASIVQLSHRSYEQRENSATWSAEDGKQAKAALITAFARLEGLIPYALSLTEGELRALTVKGGEQAFAAGIYGRAIHHGSDRPGEVLLWSKGLVHVATAP